MSCEAFSIMVPVADICIISGALHELFVKASPDVTFRIVSDELRPQNTVPTVWCFCSCGSGVQRMVGGHSFAYRCLHCQRTVPYEDQCFEIHTIRPHCFVHGERVLTVKFYDRSWYERGWVCIDPLTYDATDLCNHVVFDRIHFY